MLFRSGKNWVFDFFASRGWLIKQRRLRRRVNNRQFRTPVAAESLEDRTLLSTITVTGLTDGTSVASGVTLRDAIQAANTDTSVHGSVAGQAGVQNVIVFQAGLIGSIALDPAQGALTITSSIKIEGLGAPDTVVNGQTQTRVFDVSSGAGDVEFDNLTITQGKTTGSSQPGGGIRFLSSGTLTLEDTAMNYNYTSGASSQGAAIYSQTGNVMILGSTISNNQTSGAGSSGGAIFAQSGAVSITNSTLSGNKEWGDSSDGTAVYTLNDSAALTLTNSTVSGNNTYGTNSDGGAITSVGASITLANSIVAGNHVGVGNDDDIKFLNVDSSATFTAQSSLVGVNSGTPLAPAAVGSPDANGNLVGTAIAPLVAKLGALANNGGPTQTMALLAGSPAIDAGNNSLAVDASNAALTTDQRGAPFLRIFGTAVDMGAFETQSISLVVTSAADQLDPLYDPAQLTLRDALFLTNVCLGGNTITFSSSISGTPIDLTLGNLDIDTAVTITGDGAKNSIIDAQQQSRVFYLGTGAGNVTLSGLTITGGETWGNNSYGAGILTDSTGTLTVTDSAITGNLTTGYLGNGAGIFTKTGPLVMTNSTISGNATTGERGNGAGIYAVNSPVALANCTLSGNTTSGYRAGCAGILTLDSDALLTLTNCTVSGNANNGGNAAGGALYIVRGSITVTNSIVSGNTIATRTSADISFENYDHTGVFTAKNSIIGIDGATPLTPAPVGSPDANGNLVGTVTSPLDAKLGPLAYNGGQTQTMALLAGSPAINAGNNALAIDPTTNNPLTTDQRGAGFARFAGTVDMGAYEVQSLAVPTVNFLVTNNPLPVLTGTYDQLNTKVLQVTVDGSTFTLGTSPQLTSDGSGNWKLTMTATITDGTYNVVVQETDPSGDPATDTTAIDLVVNTQAPATTLFTGEYAVTTPGSNVLTLASITQDGVNLTLVGSASASATVTSTTQLSVGGVTATYGDSVVTFGATGAFANQVWTKLDLATDYTNPAGSRVHITQNGNGLLFSDRNGTQSAGTWTSPTTISAYGETLTIGSGRFTGQLLWQDGTIWSEVVNIMGTENGTGTTNIQAVPSNVLVTDYLTPGGTTVYTVQTGTINIVFIDRIGHIVLGTYSPYDPSTNTPQATAPDYPGYTAAIGKNTITWTDGNPADTTVWTETSSAGSTITVTDYTNQNGVPVHAIENGTNQFVIVDGLGNTSLGHFLTATTGVANNYPSDVATFSANQVTWSDGTFVWTTTNNPPLLITFTDANSAITHVKLLTSTTLVGLDGPLKGIQGTRLNGKIFWSNGQVWDNLDFDALNAFFEMGTGYP